MAQSKNISSILNHCVACGSCVKRCPFGAITIYKGIRAVVDETKCVGCKKCTGACPVQAIQIVERGVDTNEKQEME